MPKGYILTFNFAADAEQSVWTYNQFDNIFMVYLCP